MKPPLALLLALAGPLLAHEPITTKLTYTRDISRLVNRHCIACHGATAQIPLTTYEQTRPWAKAIRDQVMTRQMPPWGAVQGFGPALKADPNLTASEVETVVRWVEGGAPNGDAALLPPPVVAQPVTVETLSGPFLTLHCDWKAPRDLSLLGVRPEEMVAKDQIRISLTLPDGGVRPVIWLRQVNQPRDFIFEKPLAMPRGSILHVQTDGDSVAALRLTSAGAWLPKPETTSRKRTRSCPGQ